MEPAVFVTGEAFIKMTRLPSGELTPDNKWTRTPLPYRAQLSYYVLAQLSSYNIFFHIKPRLYQWMPQSCAQECYPSTKHLHSNLIPTFSPKLLFS